MKRRAVLLFLLVAALAWGSSAAAQDLIGLNPQVPLDPTTIPQFETPLPMLDLEGDAGVPVLVDDGTPSFIKICEFIVNVDS